MDFRPSGGRCKQESPESACPFCGGPGRIKAHRLVKSQVILDDAGKPVRIEGILRIRRQCRACLRSWTVYEQGGYPHRTFTLAVAAAAVAELVANPGATRSSVVRASCATGAPWADGRSGLPGSPTRTTCPELAFAWIPPGYPRHACIPTWDG